MNLASSASLFSRLQQPPPPPSHPLNPRPLKPPSPGRRPVQNPSVRRVPFVLSVPRHPLPPRGLPNPSPRASCRSPPPIAADGPGPDGRDAALFYGCRRPASRHRLSTRAGRHGRASRGRAPHPWSGFPWSRVAG